MLWAFSVRARCPRPPFFDNKFGINSTSWPNANVSHCSSTLPLCDLGRRRQPCKPGGRWFVRQLKSRAASPDGAVPHGSPATARALAILCFSADGVHYKWRSATSRRPWANCPLASCLSSPICPLHGTASLLRLTFNFKQRWNRRKNRSHPNQGRRHAAESAESFCAPAGSRR